MAIVQALIKVAIFFRCPSYFHGDWMCLYDKGGGVADWLGLLLLGSEVIQLLKKEKVVEKFSLQQFVPSWRAWVLNSLPIEPICFKGSYTNGFLQ
ncbi:uncharacterized protein [Rutidosis leptorrhynchoides]|uniref:uncharacterized protein isoform X2 n=1 Tax=Rutidosis leptorrhynchoides TaxID=125765 RepID=UPI003A990F82